MSIHWEPPANPQEYQATEDAELSRNAPENETKSHEVISLGAFRFDPSQPALFDATGAAVALRSQSIEVLGQLAARTGEVVAKDSLIDAVWGDTFVTDDSLVQCIADIRRALGDSDHKLVQTLPRRGYRLNSGPVAIYLPAPLLPDLAGRRAIAVLPFISLSDDPEHAFFAEGLSEDLIARLSMVRRLTVLASPSRFVFNGDALRAKNAGTDLGPEFLIKGTVRRAHDKVRVTVQLIKTESETVLLSRRYDREIHDIFEIQDDIVSDIIAETRVALTEGEIARLALRRTRSVHAWEYFHQGVLEQHKCTPEGSIAARRLYRKAMQEDPDYYDAKVADVWAVWHETRGTYLPDPENGLKRCRAALDALIAEGPQGPDALHLDAVLLVQVGRHDEAVIRAEQAHLAGPSLMYGDDIEAFVHLYCGNLQRAHDLQLANMRSAPIIGDNLLHYHAHCLTLMGKYEHALALAEEYRLRVPGTPYAYTLLATAHAMAGQPAAAAESIAVMRHAHPRFTLEIFRRHEPYREAETLDKIVAHLRRAGIPD